MRHFIIIFSILLLGTANRITATDVAGPLFKRIPSRMVAEESVRVAVDSPAKVDRQSPNYLIFYALPNGNTIEQTFGARRDPGVPWRFDIQHIGAQTSFLRETNPDANIYTVYLEAKGLSWPSWRRTQENANERIVQLVQSLKDEVLGDHNGELYLASHSGGGSFLSGYIEGSDSIDSSIHRFVYLDSNYSFDEEKHKEKLLEWMLIDDSHQVVVFAYDDRYVELNGKRIVSNTGGTLRACHRMISAFEDEVAFEKLEQDSLTIAESPQMNLFLHDNPEQKILHTTMVGEWNGFIHGVTLNGPLDGLEEGYPCDRVYMDYVLPAGLDMPDEDPVSELPPRPEDALSGSKFIEKVQDYPPDEREAAVLEEMMKGNIPDFLRNFKEITVEGKTLEGVYHSLTFYTMPDYLSIGSDEDFARMPMMPHTAQEFMDAHGLVFPTVKIVEEVTKNAEQRIEPYPLTIAREATSTFYYHHRFIEMQLGENPRRVLTSGLKKDVVISNRVYERDNRVAIYGWHYTNEKPIQPLTTVHHAGYVDYSHGIRPIKREMLVDGKPMMFEDILADPHLSELITDEGASRYWRYPEK